MVTPSRRRPAPHPIALARRLAPLTLTAAVLAGLAAPAAAQDSVTGDPGVPQTMPNQPPGADAQAFLPRDLKGCPFQTSPPPAIDESERPQPGQTVPTAPSVPSEPVGGERLGGCEQQIAKGFRMPADVTASGWVVSDLDSGEVLAAKDPHGRYRPASIIKTLLASVVIDELDPNEIITVTDTDLEGAEGSAVGVGPGGKYSVDRLLHGLLMVSGNDAALVLAHHLGGVPAALDKMNAHARELGATDTHVTSVNGLDKPGMSTSAYDMSLIFRNAMTRPEFASVVRTQQWGFPGYPAGDAAAAPDPAAPPAAAEPTTLPDGTTVNPGFVVANDNHLLAEYPGAIGGKTGFTDDARHTYIGAAERDGRRLAVVLLDGTRAPKAPWEQGAALLDAGFATPKGQTVGTLVEPTTPAGEADHAAAGPVGAADDDASGGALENYGPWVAVGACALVVVVGAAIGLRSRGRGATDKASGKTTTK